MKKYNRILLQLILAAAVIGITAETVKAKEEAVVPDTVYIEDINVSGMTKEQAQEAIDDYTAELDSTTFTLTTGDKDIQVTAEDIGLAVKNTDVVEEALNIGKTGNLIARYKAKKDLAKEKKVYDLVFGADEDKIETLLNTNSENLNQEAVNCGLVRENDSFKIIDGADGITVNTADSAKAIIEFLENEFEGKNASVQLATDVAKPKGTKEELQKVQDVLGTYHTDYSSSAGGRAKNVKIGCEKINGSVIYPGDQFSVYKEVTPFDAENGYELAGSYENGTTVQTYGGGICQVSTTLYNAVILSELAIDERFNHSMIVSYVKPSMDAAIAGTSKDLKFTNNTDAPIYIEGYTSGGNLYFTIYGEDTRDADRVVTYESETTSQTDPGVSFEATGGQPIGYIASTQSPHTGYTAKLWKVVTVNGVEQSRTEFNTSRYRASNRIYAVGVATDNPEAAAQISAAIATGDEATIRAAAAQYSGASQAAADQAAAEQAAAAQAAADQAAADQAAKDAEKEEKKEESKKEETPKEEEPQDDSGESDE